MRHVWFFRGWLVALLALSLPSTQGCGGDDRGSDDDDDTSDDDDDTSDDDDDTVCIDKDGDRLCEQDDCNDENPLQGRRHGDPGARDAIEPCDLPQGIDNDCDGSIDEDSPPLLTCRGDQILPSGDWLLDDEGRSEDRDYVEAQGVEVDPDTGTLQLQSNRTIRDYIWLANTQNHSVSKFDTQRDDDAGLYHELGRYCLAPGGSPGFCGQADPSRTTVDVEGGAYIADRSGHRLIKISPLGEDCPDTNGDGIITTWIPDLDDDPSNNPPLPWGEDDCVLWDIDLAANGLSDARGIAVQDVEGPDGERERFVWLGGSSNTTVLKIDAETGEVLFGTQAAVASYGMALDGNGNVWTTNSGQLGRLDTTLCVDEASCDVAVCGNDTPEDDLCAKQRIDDLPCSSYGITVDSKQRVWVGGQGMTRYDPRAPIGERYTTVPAVAGGPAGGPGEFDPDGVTCGSLFVHGLAADGQGYVWGAAQGSGVVRANADRPGQWLIVPGTTSFGGTTPCGPEGGGSGGPAPLECDAKGMAVDLFGKVWAVNLGETAMVIRPGPDLEDNDVEWQAAYVPGSSRYTYSDMTGIQTRLATNAFGFYRRTFVACEGTDDPPVWGSLTVDMQVPHDEDGNALAEVVISIRTAPSIDDLRREEWIEADTLQATSTIDVAELLEFNGIEPQTHLQVEARFRANARSVREVLTARIRSIELTAHCNIVLE